MSELGHWQIGTNVVGAVELVDGSNLPKEATGTPTFRVYGNGLLMNNGTGSLAKLDTGNVTNATNASPIVVTAAAHGLKTGNRVTIAGVTGNGAANGDWQVTAIDANTFSLDGSTGNGAYISGGTWHVTGLYSLTVPLNAGDNYLAGNVYTVLVNYLVGATPFALVRTFGVL